jgi:DNA-binding transcriptional ArsR family regulator
MKQSIFEIQAEFCKAMGNATRLQILHVLREHPMHVGEIAQVMGLSQSLVSRQLHVLRNIDVVHCQRQGNEMLYQLSNEGISEVCDLVRKVLSEQMHRQSEVLR